MFISSALKILVALFNFQAMFSVEGRKDALASTREVLYPSKNWSSGVDSDRLDTAYTHIPEVHKLATRDEKTSGWLGPANIQIPGLNLEISSDANLGRIPSELISTCVAALFMIEVSCANVLKYIDKAYFLYLV